MPGDSLDKRCDDMALLIDMESPSAVFDEIVRTMAMAYPGAEFKRAATVNADVVGIYRGENPDYKGCNTGYHDLKHTTDVALAMARTLHGMATLGEPVSADMAELGVMAALLHDTGYIQGKLDNDGSGAKFTTIHVSRSVEFTKRYCEQKGFALDSVYATCARMIMVTDLAVQFGEVPFEGEDEARVAKALMAADLIGQVSDRIYLEKLLFLYREFSEGHVMGFSGEKDLLEKTVGFYDFIRARLINQADYTEAPMRAHFRERWHMDRDLYGIAMEKNMVYLRQILANREKGHRDMLNRAGIVKRLFTLGF